MASYANEVHQQLNDLLRDFGTPNKTRHPEYPFWHLRSDAGGVWELERYAGVSLTSGGSATSGELIRHDVRGGLPERLYRLLRRNPAMVQTAADMLLYKHFPNTMHDAIRERVGLPRDSVARGLVAQKGQAMYRRSWRDPDFRDAVLHAYDHRCAVCDFDLQVRHDSFGLEAAHIMWHAAGGPDQVPNGLALCTLHHRALDWGVLGLEPESGEYHLLVSSELQGHSRAFDEMLNLQGKRLRPPQDKELQPAAEYVDWHREQVFR